MNLKQIAEALREDQLTALFAAASDDFADDQVVVMLESDSFEEPLTVQILRTNPEDDENLKGLMMLQFFAHLPVDVETAQVDAVQRALPIVNTAAPLMGFNVIPSERSVFFRHIALVPEEGPGALRVLQETTWMTFFILERWGPDLIGVAAGDLDLNDLLS